MKIIVLFLCIIAGISSFCMEDQEIFYARGKEFDLFQAIEFNQVELVKQLINEGIDVTIKRKYNGQIRQPIHFAADKKRYEIFLLLSTALILPYEKKFFKAVEVNNIDKVKKLIIYKKIFPLMLAVKSEEIRPEKNIHLT